MFFYIVLTAAHDRSHSWSLFSYTCLHIKLWFAIYVTVSTSSCDAGFSETWCCAQSDFLLIASICS